MTPHWGTHVLQDNFSLFDRQAGGYAKKFREKTCEQIVTGLGPEFIGSSSLLEKWNECRFANYIPLSVRLQQRIGRGIATARREMEKNGNPALEFAISPSAIVVALKARTEP